MYQAIYYDYFNKTAHLRDDELGWNSFAYQPTYYKISPTGTMPTLDGKRANPTKKFDKLDKDLYEKDVDKNLAVLLDIYLEDDSVPKFHNKAFKESLQVVVTKDITVVLYFVSKDLKANLLSPESKNIKCSTSVKSKNTFLIQVCSKFLFIIQRYLNYLINLKNLLTFLL